MENNTENSNKKRGLGKMSLFGDVAAGATTQPKSMVNQEPRQVVVEKIVEKIVEQKIDEDKRVWSIAVDKLVPGQYQPRKKFEKELLNELAQSIKENGILQPIVV